MVVIYGEYLDSGLVAGDFTVSLYAGEHGEFPCKVMALTSTELRCQPPDDIEMPRYMRGQLVALVEVSKLDHSAIYRAYRLV